MIAATHYTFGQAEHTALPITPCILDLNHGHRPAVLIGALRLHRLGLCVIPIKRGSKQPAVDEWKPFQSIRPTGEQLRSWFENGECNVAIVCGRVSGIAVVDTDSPEAEAWVLEHLPPTPMRTRTARGFHHYYRLPNGPWVGVDLPHEIVGSDTLKVEVRHDGQYVVAPGSVHPSGHLYVEVEPWPACLDSVPEFPMDTVARLVVGITPTRAWSAPIPNAIASGARNTTLFREGARLRRLGWNHAEITKALLMLNAERCQPPLADREVEGIAASCARYEPARDTFPLTEAGDAEYFAACFPDSVRYDHRRGRWLPFECHHWRSQSNGEIDRLALDAIRGRQSAALTIKDDDTRRRERLKWAVAGESRKRLSNLLALARNLAPLADAGDRWDDDPWLLGVRNGVVDLRTGQLRDGEPADRITMRTAVEFDPRATCPLWDRTVRDIFHDNCEVIAYFDRYVGYSLTGDCREETLAFCLGGGANGKGTVVNTLAWVLGDYADDLPFSALELHERAGIPNDIAKIVGKRFVTSSETGETKRLNEARVKALTGRDPITARFLHQEYFTFQPVAKFWLATNQKPVVRDTSIGFWRRIHLIPFTRSFIDKPDLRLKDKLRLEGPGILARAVRGCLDWQLRGLDPPSSVREATNSYRVDSLPLTRFIEARCVRRDGARATFGDLFDSYLRWCGDTREVQRLTRREFSEVLRAQFQVDPASKRNVTFLGIGLESPLVQDELL